MFYSWLKPTVKQTLRQKADIILIQIIGFAAVVAIGLIALIIKFSNDIYLSTQFLLGKIHSVCGCLTSLSFLSFTRHPWIFGALFTGAIFLAVMVSFTAYSIIRLCRKTRKFVKINLNRQKIKLSGKLSAITDQINITSKIIEIESSQPIVFCFGFIKPKICISSALVYNLSKNELRAVLLHERFHLNSSEPIKLLLVKVISLLLFFVPGIKLLAKKYLAFSELSADEAATKNFTDKIPLASALRKIIGWEQKQAFGKLFALSFFSAVTEERILKLTDESYAPSAVWFTKKTMVGVFCAIIIFAATNLMLSTQNIKKIFDTHAPAAACAQSNQPMAAINNSCNQLPTSNSCNITYYSATANKC